MITQKQYRTIVDMIRDIYKGDERVEIANKIRERFGVWTLTQLTEDDAVRVINRLEEKFAEQAEEIFNPNN